MASVLYVRPATLAPSVETGWVGNRPADRPVSVPNGQSPDVYDDLVRLLRPRQGAARRQGRRVRRDQPGRRPALPTEADGPDRRLDGSPDPARRPADRGLHRALAPGQERPARRTPFRFVNLAEKAVPRASPAQAVLFDRRPAAQAGLALTAVPLELVLHPPRAAIGRAVVAQCRALAIDPGFESPPHPSVKRPDLTLTKLACRSARIDPSPPKRLVRIDVPDTREGALVEQSRLDGRLAALQPQGEVTRGEGGLQRLDPQPGGEVAVELVGAEHEPGAEAPDVAIG